MVITVREIRPNDVPMISAYWKDASPEFLRSMGADPDLQPDPDEFNKMLQAQISLPYNEKQSYCIIWLIDEKPVGHCNVNKIVFGEQAYMHLHLWNVGNRQQGLGTAFVKLSIPYFFTNLQLETLFCEPYALNAAPNNTLRHVGFQFVEEHVTTPGSFCFEQPVMKWALKRNVF